VTEKLEKDSRWRPLKPLAVPVRTAARLLGIGTTSTWGLIATRRVGVIRIGRRTLVTMASLEALVAALASSHLEPEELIESGNVGPDKMNSIEMTLEEVKARMSAAGISIASETRLPNDSGTHIVTVSGQVADAYDSGTLVVHGRNAAELRRALGVDGNSQPGPDK